MLAFAKTSKEVGYLFSDIVLASQFSITRSVDLKESYLFLRLIDARKKLPTK